MSRSSKSRMYYSEDLKLSVLKDKYENNLSLGCAAKKYGIKTHTCICAWEKKYPVDSKLLSLSDEVITRVNMAHPTNPVEEGIRMLTQKLSLYDT